MNRHVAASLVALVVASAASADDFPKAIDTETDKTPVMPADQSAKGFKVPEGFKVTVYAAEPDVLVKQLAADEAIAAADTLLLTVPNQLGVDYNAHAINSILKFVAPELGWR